jgi:hypothetical protein
MSVHHPSQTRGHGIEARDAGLAFLSRLNRWLVAGAVGAAGALSLLAANGFHGKSRSATVTPQRAAAGSRSSAPVVQSSPGGQSAPAPVSSAPVVPAAPVVSGGS